MRVTLGYKLPNLTIFCSISHIAFIFRNFTKVQDDIFDISIEFLAPMFLL